MQPGHRCKFVSVEPTMHFDNHQKPPSLSIQTHVCRPQQSSQHNLHFNCMLVQLPRVLILEMHSTRLPSTPVLERPLLQCNLVCSPAALKLWLLLSFASIACFLAMCLLLSSTAANEFWSQVFITKLVLSVAQICNTTSIHNFVQLWPAVSKYCLSCFVSTDLHHMSHSYCLHCKRLW